jgi:chromosome segregation ATPase
MEHLARLEGELSQSRERITALEGQLATHRDMRRNSELELIKVREKVKELEAQEIRLEIERDKAISAQTAAEEEAMGCEAVSRNLQREVSELKKVVEDLEERNQVVLEANRGKSTRVFSSFSYQANSFFRSRALEWARSNRDPR